MSQEIVRNLTKIKAIASDNQAQVGKTQDPAIQLQYLSRALGELTKRLGKSRRVL